MDKHFDKLKEIIEQLRAMETVFHEFLVIGILVASIDVPKLNPVTAAKITFAEKDVIWEDVSED